MTNVTVAAESLRQVDRIRATVVGKSYPLTLTKEYVSKWRMAEAVRELIQNALDSQSPFVYSWIKEDDAWTLMLNSELTVLSPQTLLLGATTKGKDEESIGSFGEGYKLALLVLTRMGIHVDMLNGDVLWRPVFRYNRNFDAELLCIDESFLQEKGNKGLTFYVRGLTEADKDEIVGSCIRMQDDIGAIKQTEYGDILMDKKGLLYVGGLYICMTDLHFGYNVKPKHMRLERDRQTVSDWDLRTLTTKMWFSTDDTLKVAEMIEKEVPDVSHAKYDAPEIVKNEVYRIFRQKHPNALLAESVEEARQSIKEGLIEKVYVGGNYTSYHSAVASSSVYRAEVEELNNRLVPPPKPDPDDVLSSFLQAYKDGMSQKTREGFSGLIAQARDWRWR